MRRLIITALVLAGAIAAWSAWALYAANSFSGRIAAIRAAGDPASIADLRPAPLAALQNAEIYLSANSSLSKAFAGDHGRFFKTPVGQTYDQRSEGAPLTAEQSAAIRAIVEQYPEIDAAIDRAAECDHFAAEHDYSLPHSQFVDKLADSQLRTFARYARWRIELAIAEDRPSDAVERATQLLKLGRLARREPGIVSNLIAQAVVGSATGAACEALAAGRVTAEARAALNRELALHDDLQPMVSVLKSERALMISALNEQFSGVRGVLMNTVGRFQNMQFTAGLDVFDAVLADAAVPWHKLVATSPGSLLFKQSSNAAGMAAIVQPSLPGTFLVANRILSITRSLRILNALQAFAEDNGREAGGFADLVLPKGATIDPFSGQPLKLKRTNDGWLIYSVGEDGVDDGGSFDDSKDYGLRPRESVK